MHYAAYIQHGWPVGPGEVENAHRYMPQEQLKSAGAGWHPQNVNPILVLRVIRTNGYWDTFWQSHAQHSHGQQAV